MSDKYQIDLSAISDRAIDHYSKDGHSFGAHFEIVSDVVALLEEVRRLSAENSNLTHDLRIAGAWLKCEAEDIDYVAQLESEINELLVAKWQNNKGVNDD